MSHPPQSESGLPLLWPAAILLGGLVVTGGFWLTQQLSLDQQREAMRAHQADYLRERLQTQLDDYTEVLRQTEAQLAASPAINPLSFQRALDRLQFSRRRISIEQLGYARFAGSGKPATERLIVDYLGTRHHPLKAPATDLLAPADNRAILQRQRPEVLLLAPGSLPDQAGPASWMTIARPMHLHDTEPVAGWPWGALLLNVPLSLLVERIQPRLGEWEPALQLTDLGSQQRPAQPQVLFTSPELATRSAQRSERQDTLEVLGRRWQIDYYYLTAAPWEKRLLQQQRSIALIGVGSSLGISLGLGWLLAQRRRGRRRLAAQQSALAQQTRENASWRQLVADAGEALLVLDLSGNVISCNPAAAALTGYDASMLQGKTLHELGIYPPQDYPDAVASIRGAASDTRLLEIASQSGWPIPVQLRTSPYRDEQGRLIGQVQVLTDQRDITHAEQRLRDVQQQLLDFMLLSQESGWETDAELRLRSLAGNPVPGAVLDLRRLTGLRLWELPGFAADESALAEQQAVMAAQRPFDSFHFRLTGEPGGVRHLELSGKPVYDSAGQFSGYRGVARDVSHLLAARLAAQTERERALITLASIADAVVTTDIEGKIDYLNPAAEQFTGWAAADALGKPSGFVLKLLDDRTRDSLPDPILQALHERQAIAGNGHTSLIRLDGQEFAVEATAAPILDSQGQACGAVLVLHDVTQSRQLADKLSYQASHDELTGLPNRRAFEQQLRLLLQSPLQATEHTLLFLDLDQFKIVNDTCGHVAGDQMLRQIATLLRQQLRSNDICARLGGDEFGVLLDSCPQEVALRIADKLRNGVSEFRFVWDDKLFHVGLSIGLVSFCPGSFDQVTLLSAADTACYMAKEKGRNRVQVHHQDDAEVAIRRGEMQWLARINAALREDRFQLYFQTIAPNVGTDGGLHFEVLVRMVGEDGQLIPPGAFIPAAERYHLMNVIDRWIIRHTFAFIDDNRDRLPPIAACGINLSGASMIDTDLLQFIQHQLHLYRIQPEQICFEITETAAIANLGQATQLIAELKQMGCQFALDDFGSGMSSFGYLKHLPVDYLKIDGSFVKNMVDDPIDAAMVEAINNIGHVMGLKTIAEFVENDAIRAALTQLGVDYSQGWGIARPVPAAALLEF